MSLCSLSYLDGVLDRASTISCGSDTVTCPGMGRIITPLPHDIAQMLTSPHLNRNLYICRCCCRCRFHRRRYHPFFVLYFHPWKCGLLSSITLVFVVSILGTEGTTPRLLCLFSRHNNSGSCGVIRLKFFVWQMAR